MKKEAERKKDTVIRRNTGLPRDDVKELEEFKSKLRKELEELKKEELKKKDKKKKGK